MRINQAELFSHIIITKIINKDPNKIIFRESKQQKLNLGHYICDLRGLRSDGDGFTSESS
jgi:hypothetical protein